MTAPVETVDASMLIEALEHQRNQAMTQAAMAIARSTALAKENAELKRQVSILERGGDHA